MVSICSVELTHGRYFSGDEAFDDIAQKQPQGNQIDSAAEVKDKADIPSKL